ncbi:hypothetical protein evm_000007 [Chilo suppressalis]|nr:hypothetical protein evm_000007 [Chilo suppressalis]
MDEVSWESYNANVCKGFSALQQNGEFVDMTLAADGCYVKVHQVLVALASPFLKELIASAPCPHPVVFLYNISQKTLSYLLEYIYTGEVLVPADKISSFVAAAKSLHIKGLENFISNENLLDNVAAQPQQVEESGLGHMTGIKRVAVGVNQRVEQIGLPAGAKRICIKQESTATPVKIPDTVINKADYDDCDDHMDEGITHDDTDDNDHNDSSLSTSNATYTPSSNLQFTVSIRGSLQIILNRYIYNMHSITHRRGVRRWRCVDYRNHKCMAFVVTKGNVVLNRANLHNHPYHDKKIIAKIEKKCVYSALDDVKGYKEKDDSKIEECDDFMPMDDFTEIDDKSSDFLKES